MRSDCCHPAEALVAKLFVPQQRRRHSHHPNITRAPWRRWGSFSHQSVACRERIAFRFTASETVERRGRTGGAKAHHRLRVHLSEHSFG